jgi:Na+/H+ antiporter NhaA
MKKILMIAFIIGFVCVGNALADEYVSGSLTVLDMTIYESQPTPNDVIVPCQVYFNFYTDSGQEYFLFADAYGTQLNLALWKAALDGVTVRSMLRYTIIPLVIDIAYVNWPA